ncbi:MAG: hypothetical protein ACTHOO_03105 [Alcanivorax sp.]
MSKILITAFKPFGLIGAWLRQSNASEDVLAALNKHQNETFENLIISASDQGIEAFLEELDRIQPSGIISMGEHMLIPSTNILIEPHAYDTNTTALPLKHLFSDKVESSFATNHASSPTKSMIGGYYCNQIYLQGLNWAKENGNIPVAFVHVPVLGDPDHKAEQVSALLKSMQDDIANPQHNNHILE